MNEGNIQLAQVVGVKFKSRGKTYFFDPVGIEVAAGDDVVVETSKGLELADCVQGNHYVRQDRVVQPLRPVVRIATEDDLRVAKLCAEREKDAFKICEEKIAEHKLDMKLVDVECNFEGTKILFFFTSDGRVDFRELVKDLAGIFRTRIELRQIGVRDEAKILGGLGICGRQFCCNRFLDDFQPVSTKMAKTQSLSLNPAKISGSCGRLMCCLRYEQEAYEELVKTIPKNGSFVETPHGYGNVIQVNLLRQKVKVKIDGEDAHDIHVYDADEVAAIPGGRPKPGEPLPHILEIKKKPQEEPEEEDASSWTLPPMFAEDTANGEQGQKKQGYGRAGGRKKGPPPSAEGQKKTPPQENSQGKQANNHRGGRKKPKSQGGQRISAPEKTNTQPVSPAQAQQENKPTSEKKKNPRRRYGRGKAKPSGQTPE